MNYLIFLAVAFFFGLLGFSLHAIFFNRTRIIQRLTQSNTALREDLRRKEREVQDTREAMVGSDQHVNMLEHQLRQRNLELNDLYHEALHSEERIALLERSVTEVFPARRETKEDDGISSISGHLSDSDNFRHFTGSAVAKGDLVRLRGKDRVARCREEPLWRKKLHTVLHVLNEMEK